MNKDIGIYCITNKINNKKYIGQSIHIKKRWIEHKWKLNNNLHENDYLQKSWNKYGQDNFEFSIIELCDVENLDDREDYYISLYNNINDVHGYNLVYGTGTNRVITEEVREKLREAGRKTKGIKRPSGKDHHLYGKHLSEETKEKIRQAHIGTKASEETRQKLSNMRKGANSPKAVAVYCPELDESFWGATEVQAKYGINKNHISSCIHGTRKHAGKHPITGEQLTWVKLENKNY